MAEYQRGQGSDALPQGGASQVNASTPGASQFDQLAMESPEVPVDFVPGNHGMAVPPTNDDLDEDMQILADGPDPGRVVPMVKQNPNRLPKYIIRHLPQFRAAAMAPDAPPAMLALYKAAIRQLEDEQRRAG